MKEPSTMSRSSSPEEHPRVGYVVKRYPRFSETFIVNEVLAHEEAGLPVSIFALRPPVDSHFQAELARVRAPVTYLPGARSVRGRDLLRAMQSVDEAMPGRLELDRLLRASDPRTLLQGLELALEVHRQGIGHLHAHFATSPAAVAAVAADVAVVGFSFTAHAKDIFHDDVDPHALGDLLRSADAVVTVSDFNVADLRRRFGPAADGVRRVYNGLDLELFPAEPATRAADRILAVGRLVEKKGFDVLIDACAILRSQGREATCRIIGGGELEHALAARIRDRGLEGWVTLAGPVPRERLLRELGQSALLAAPCVEGSDGNRDGMPTVLLEAMALGVPCVSTHVTGIPELIDDGVSGLLVEPRDPAALAEALKQVLDDPARARTMGTRARRRIENDFDIRRNAAELRALFRQGAQAGEGERTHAA
jgi:colanic acid/amylovoran biosynthesis glycosyltransferase